MGRNGPLGSLRAFDAFSKPLEDVRIRSSSGALLTFASFLLISILTLSSYLDYRKVHLTHSLEVDRSRGERLAVDVDISFPRVPCFLLSLDVMDISGEHFDDVKHDMERIRLDHSGRQIDEGKKGLRGEADKIAATRGKNYCGSCYGARQGCCNSCDDVQSAYQAVGWSFSEPETIEQCVQEHWTDKLREQSKEGCRVRGRVFVNKVSVSCSSPYPGRGVVAKTLTCSLQPCPHRSPRTCTSHRDVASRATRSICTTSSRTSRARARSTTPLSTRFTSEPEKRGYLPASRRRKLIITLSPRRFSFGAENEFDTTPGHPHTLGKAAKQRLDIVDPLSGTTAKTANSEYMFQYFVKVVSTRYRSLAGETIDTFQYAATGYDRDLSPQGRMGRIGDGAKSQGKDASSTHQPHQVQHGFAGIPGVFFNYEISPLVSGAQQASIQRTAAHLLPSLRSSASTARHASRIHDALWSLPLLPVLNRRWSPHRRRPSRCSRLELEDQKKRQHGIQRWRWWSRELPVK